VPSLQEECQITVERLRASLIDLYASVGADPETPQDVSRTFKLNASLTWNISKLIKAPDGLTAVPHVPGAKSLERVLAATKAHGAPDRAIQNVRDAVAEFEQMIEVHVGDRPTLDLIIDGLGASSGDALINSRKRSFQGDSGIYGIQAKCCMGCFFVAPNPDDSTMLDLVEIRGYFGVRRLRADVRQPLFIQRNMSNENQEFVTSAWTPLSNDSKSIILPEYHNEGDPEFEVIEVQDGSDLYVLPGQLGNRGKFDCVIADKLVNGVGRYKCGADETGEFGITPTMPTEQMIFDIIAHRDTDFVLRSENYLYAPSMTRIERQNHWENARQLPMMGRPFELAGSPPAVATPLIPKYPELLKKVFDSLGWNPTDFRGSRFEMKYPPLGAALNRRFTLPENDA